MERYPQGIGEKGFLQKNLGKGTPVWLERVEVPKRGGVVVHPLVNDLRSILWMANQNCITPHVWSSRTPNLLHPDICVFDLDPSEEDSSQLRAAALALRDLLEELNLPSWVKTSGSKGFHIVVPLDAKGEFDGVSLFANAVAKVLVSRDPTNLTQEFIKADRGERIFVDVGRNAYGATYAAAYAVRTRPGAPVSAPCTWEEVASGAVSPQTFTLRTMGERIEAYGDLWAELGSHRRSLRAALVQLRKMLGPDWPEDPSGRQPAGRLAALREGRARRSAQHGPTASD
jgi:bifunctional non-homologous end joining protein LigD